jgi:hypothetical protein
VFLALHMPFTTGSGYVCNDTMLGSVHKCTGVGESRSGQGAPHGWTAVTIWYTRAIDSIVGPTSKIARRVQISELRPLQVKALAKWFCW